MPGYNPNDLSDPLDQAPLAPQPDETQLPAADKKRRLVPMLRSLALGPLANMGANDTIQSRLAPVIQGFLAGAAQPNIAHGGGTDVFRAAFAGMNEPVRRAQLNAQLASQLAQTRHNNAMSDYLDERPVLERGKQDVTKRGQDIRSSDAAHGRDLKETLFTAGEQGKGERQDKTITGQNYRNASNNQVKGLGLGYDIQTDVTKPGGTGIVPMARPVIKPLATDALSQQAKAKVESTQAGTELTKEKTKQLPQLTAVRNRIASADLMRAQTMQDQATLAKLKYNWEFNGIDDKGNPVYLDEDGNKVIPKLMAGMKLSAGEIATANQAAIAKNAADKLMQSIKANAGRMGPLAGRGMNWQQALETLDPSAAKLITDMDILASVLPATHRMRGQGAYKIFHETIGTPAQNPQALLGKIKDIRDMSEEIERINSTKRLPRMPKSRGAGAATGDSAGADKPGMEHWSRDASGNLVRQQ